MSSREAKPVARILGISEILFNRKSLTVEFDDLLWSQIHSARCQTPGVLHPCLFDANNGGGNRKVILCDPRVAEHPTATVCRHPLTRRAALTFSISYCDDFAKSDGVVEAY